MKQRLQPFTAARGDGETEMPRIASAPVCGLLSACLQFVVVGMLQSHVFQGVDGRWRNRATKKHGVELARKI